MINYFYDKTCNIWRVTYTIVKGSQKPVESMLYENIKCSFWKTSQTDNLKDSELTRQLDKEIHKVDLQPQYNQVIMGDSIELFNSLGTSIGKYEVISTPEPYEDITGRIDNIALFVSSRP